MNLAERTHPVKGDESIVKVSGCHDDEPAHRDATRDGYQPYRRKRDRHLVLNVRVTLGSARVVSVGG